MKESDQLTFENFEKEFLILQKNKKYKCWNCGSIDETMYVSSNIYCCKCFPIQHRIKKPVQHKIKNPLRKLDSEYGLITEALTKEKLIDLENNEGHFPHYLHLTERQIDSLLQTKTRISHSMSSVQVCRWSKQP
jgi:hypothetical protein